jgi:hypothetical protein
MPAARAATETRDGASAATRAAATASLDSVCITYSPQCDEMAKFGEGN